MGIINYKIAEIANILSEKIEECYKEKKYEHHLTHLKNWEKKFKNKNNLEVLEPNFSKEDKLSKDKNYDNRVRNEKKNFNTYIFDLNERISYLAYEDSLKKEAINDFLYDLITIKERNSAEEEILLYQVNSRRRNEKNFSYNFYKDLSKDGLEITVLCELVFRYILNIDSLQDIVEYSKIENIKYNIEFIENINTTFDFSNLLKKINLKNSSFLTLKEEEKKEIYLERAYYKYLENIKYNFYQQIEIISLNNPEKIKSIIQFIKAKESKIIFRLEENKKIIKEKTLNTSKKIFLKIEKEEYKEKTGREWKKFSIEQLKKLPIDDFIFYFSEYQYFFFMEESDKATIKDFLARCFINWLKFNQLIIEITLYLKLIKEVKYMKNSIFEKKYRTLKNKYEKKDKDYFLNLFNEDIQYSHIKISSSRGVFEAKDYIINSSKIDRIKKYEKAYKQYEEFLLYKFCCIKKFFITKYKNDKYFLDFSELINEYLNLLIKVFEKDKGFDSFAQGIIHETFLQELINESFFIKNKYIL